MTTIPNTYIEERIKKFLSESFAGVKIKQSIREDFWMIQMSYIRLCPTDEIIIINNKKYYIRYGKVMGFYEYLLHPGCTDIMLLIGWDYMTFGAEPESLSLMSTYATVDGTLTYEFFIDDKK